MVFFCRLEKASTYLMFNILTTSIIMLSILIYSDNRQDLLLTLFILLTIQNQPLCCLCSSLLIQFFCLFMFSQLRVLLLIRVHLGRNSQLKIKP